MVEFLKHALGKRDYHGVKRTSLVEKQDAREQGTVDLRPAELFKSEVLSGATDRPKFYSTLMDYDKFSALQTKYIGY